MSAEELAPTIYDAFRVAQDGRPGPTLVDIPRDVQQELAEFDYMEVPQRPYTQVLSDTRANLPRAAQLINEARRPLIIAGHGVLASRAWDELKELSERTDIPVVNTLLGLSSFPRDHPLSLGMLGMHGMYWANIAVDQADLIVGLGMRFDDRITGRPGTFAPHAKVVHLDIEASQIGRNVQADVGLVGDVKAVLRALLPLVRRVERSPWRAHIETLKREHPSLSIPHSDSLLAQHVLQDLNTLIQQDEDVIAVPGVGQHQMWAAQYLFFNRANSFISSGGLGAMGFEIPAAMGAQVGRPGATVWSIAGDGGFQMTLQELATMANEKIPVKIALFNNGHLGMVRQWQELFYDKRYKAVPVPGPDYVKLADAYGIPALRVNCPQGVLPALTRAREHPGPFLIDFVLDHQENVYPMVPLGASLAETVEDARTAIPRS
jgi:acetolactate synthase-1/2/3 large subunit